MTDELPIIKRCSYRHCPNIIEGKSNKKFCCENHRKMEHTYKNRRNKWMKDAITLNQRDIDGYKSIVEYVKNNNN